VRAVLLGFAFGVWCLQQRASLPGWGGYVLCGALIGFCCMLGVLGVLRVSRPRVLVIAACVCGFTFAAWRADMRMSQQLPVACEQRDIALTGFVRGMPEAHEEGTRFLFEVESNGAGLRDFPRIVRLLWVPGDGALPPLYAGDRWALTARLKRAHANANFALRDMEVAMLERGIRATGSVSNAARPRRLASMAFGPVLMIDRLRSHLRERIETVLGDAPHRGIVIALAVGAQDAISDADWSVMRATGTSHLVAISGLHIGFVAGLAALACGFIWRRMAFRGMRAPLIFPAPMASALGAAFFAACYAALAGFNVPAQRTFWMLFAFAIAYVRGRRPASSLVLCWALALVLIADPWAVTSPGFWLSFCAVGAILFAIQARGAQAKRARAEADDALDWDKGIGQSASAEGQDAEYERLVAACERNMPNPRVARVRVSLKHAFGWPARAVRQGVLRVHRHIQSGARVQYAVTIALAPLTVYWFSQIPLIGPLANAFAIPWVSFFVTPATLAGLVLPAPLDAFAFGTAHAALTVLCDALARLADAAAPFHPLWHVPQPGWFALAASGVGIVWALAPRGWPMRWAAPLTWLPLVAPAPYAAPEGAFRVTALDIGQGSALVIETARHTLLFDAGPGPESTHAGERITAPYLLASGVHSLDAMIISHSDSDHAGGAPAVLEAVAVRQLLASLPKDHPLWSDAHRRGAQSVRCAAGQHWTWDGVDFRMLWPDPGPLTGKPNDQACVLKVTNASGHAALFTADIEANVERMLIARERATLEADVLIAPHHGSRTSSTEPFLDSVGPLVAVFQVGYRNRFRHPNPTVFARYQMRDIVLSRSDQDGAARIEIGSQITVERFRETHARYWMNHTQ
jgi:competence protein ComEC